MSGNISGACTDVFRGHVAAVRSVTSVAFSPDGARVVSGSLDNTVLVWKTASREGIGAKR